MRNRGCLDSDSIGPSSSAPYRRFPGISGGFGPQAAPCGPNAAGLQRPDSNGDTTIFRPMCGSGAYTPQRGVQTAWARGRRPLGIGLVDSRWTPLVTRSLPWFRADCGSRIRARANSSFTFPDSRLGRHAAGLANALRLITPLQGTSGDPDTSPAGEEQGDTRRARKQSWSPHQCPMMIRSPRHRGPGKGRPAGDDRNAADGIPESAHHFDPVPAASIEAGGQQRGGGTCAGEAGTPSQRGAHRPGGREQR
jgi:hypothetical protein